ncbi:hypothetical protein EDB19DRAFT_604137 [Suillus lakei]|nr:hypothetical protein EDB19DRAFT_604137 [Suillus lakei]
MSAPAAYLAQLPAVRRSTGHLLVSALGGIRITAYCASSVINLNVGTLTHFSSPLLPLNFIRTSISYTSYPTTRPIFSHPTRTIMPSSLEGQSIRLDSLEVTSGKISKSPPSAYPQACSSLNRRRKSSTSSIIRQCYDMGRYSDNVKTYAETCGRYSSTHDSPDALEIRVSFELGRMLGYGKPIGKLDHHGMSCLIT